MRLILVRHGESVGNHEGRLQGQGEFDLTDLGRRQALLVGERLAREGTTALYASPLLRAWKTGETIGQALGVQPVELPGVREYDFGEMAGMTYAEVRQRFASSGTENRPADRVYPGEEGRDVFYKRVTESVWDCVRQHPGETIALVSHGGPIALFCQSALGLPYRRPMPFAIDNCSLNVFQVRDEAGPDGRWPRAVVTALNDTCHLASLRKPAGER